MTLPLARVRLPYSTVVIGAGLIVAADMTLEHYLAFQTFSNLTFSLVLRHLVLPALTVYMLIMLRALNDVAVDGLAKLRPHIQISESEYERHVHLMVAPEGRTELGLLLASLVIVYAWFVALGQAPLIVETVPLNLPPAGALVLITYVLFGWIGLRLVYSVIQVGRGLGSLAQRPLIINVFDPTNLLAFGHIALMHSVAMAGVVLILLVGYGGPSQLDEWAALVLASLSSLVALIIPLWGVNRQMRASKYKALVRIHDQLKEIDKSILGLHNMGGEELKELTDRTVTLINLRKVIQESPTWPFRDTATVLRAIAVVLAPLIYFTSTEFIRTYFFYGK